MSYMPKHYRYIDSYDETGVSIHLVEFIALEETPQGYWVIRRGMDFTPSMIKKHRKWVSKNSVRRHCYPSKAEAFQSYLSRKRRQIGHLSVQLAVAEQALAHAETIKSDADAIERIRFNEGADCGKPELFSSLAWDY